MRIALVMAVVFIVGVFAPIRGSASVPATVQVVPATSSFTQPVHISVKGLPPRQVASITLSATDRKGERWTSSATYRTTPSGGINVDRSSALLGSYQGVNGMGLVESMTPTKQAADDPEFAWGIESAPLLFHVAVNVHGHQFVATTFGRRGLAPGVRVQRKTLTGAGFDGLWWLPPPGTPRQPGVLVFGGSEGGRSGDAISAALASAGYPTLDIAYFQGRDPAAAPGLPKTLHNIPLEYFAKALRWLADRPQVERRKLYVLSGSRGSEAAFLLGVHYPNLVHGVIDLSPSDVVNGSFATPGGSAWTFRGKPLFFNQGPIGPGFTLGVGTKAQIPVQDIHGPILLACGGDDQVWDSCGYSQDVEHRLATSHGPFAHPLYMYPNAGHGVDALSAYEPVAPAALSINTEGLTPLSNEQADAKLWPNVLHFLATT